MTTTESGQLRVGAAKVDITPPEDALPSDYKSIHDPIYARAIVLDNRHTKAVLLGIDVVMLLEGVYTELAQQIMAEVGCPIENILMTATHTLPLASAQMDSAKCGSLLTRNRPNGSSKALLKLCVRPMPTCNRHGWAMEPDYFT
jgi:hypothetical protein